MQTVSFQELLSVTAAYAGEWGRDSIRISVPVHWSNLAPLNSIAIPPLIDFTTKHTIVVRVVQQGLTMLTYTAEADPVLKELARRDP